MKNRSPQGNTVAPSQVVTVLEIPLDQLHRNPNQPRGRFKKKALIELAESIKSQGLQQPPVVNFWKEEDGRKHYVMKAGERRWKAHQINGARTMLCVVSPVPYPGHELNPDWQLAQSAENNSREPQDDRDLTIVTRNQVNQEISRRSARGEPVKGAIEVALLKVAKAHGKSIWWARPYHKLGNLVPQLLDMLGEDEDGNPQLDFHTGLSLAGAPPEEQIGLYEKSKEVEASKGHDASVKFIAREARRLKEARGEKVKGRKIDQKATFIRSSLKFKRVADTYRDGRTYEELAEYVKTMLAKMGATELDPFLNELTEGCEVIGLLLDLTQAQRDSNYAHLKATPKVTKGGQQVPAEEDGAGIVDDEADVDEDVVRVGA